MPTVYIGSDHAGFEFKTQLVEELKKMFPDYTWEDLGCHSAERCNYPDFGKSVGEKVASNQARGLLVCGSGIGIMIAANKVPGVRAATIWDETSARLSRQHNDANVLCLGSRLIGMATALEICKVWFETEFEGGRHQDRVSLIHAIEEKK